NQERHRQLCRIVLAPNGESRFVRLPGHLDRRILRIHGTHRLSQYLERERIVGIFLGQLHEAPNELVSGLDGFLALLVSLRFPEIGADLSGFLEGLLVFLRERAGLFGAGIGGSYCVGDAENCQYRSGESHENAYLFPTERNPTFMRPVARFAARCPEKLHGPPYLATFRSPCPYSEMKSRSPNRFR